MMDPKSSSTSLLEKYAHLHSDMDHARQESAKCLMEIQHCQTQIQTLVEHRQILKESTLQNCQEQELLQKHVHDTSCQLDTLQKDYDQAMTRREHAQHVQTMIQRRIETSRTDYEHSLHTFTTSCQDVLLLQLSSLVYPPQDKVVPHTSISLSQEDNPCDDTKCDYQQEDHHSEKDCQQSTTTTTTTTTTNFNDNNNNNKNSCHILKLDWKSLFAQVLLLPSTGDCIRNNDVTTKPSFFQDGDRECQHHHEHEEQKDCIEPCLPANDDMSSRIKDGMHYSNDEESTPTLVPIQVTTTEDGCSTPEPPTLTSSSLFSQALHIIEMVHAAKESNWNKVQQRLTAAQNHHDQALQDYDDVYNEHQSWIAKITRQRIQKEQLQRQFERLQNDIQDLQGQMDHVHSQTLELQQELKTNQCHQNKHSATDTANAGNQSGRPPDRLASRQRAGSGRPHHGTNQESSQDTTSLQVLNPYLRSKRKVPSHVLNETDTTRTDTSRKNTVSHHHTVISPFGETQRNAPSSILHCQHPHRVGQVRGARDFGVSLSLKPVTSMIPSKFCNSFEYDETPKAKRQSTVRNNVENEVIKVCNDNHPHQRNQERERSYSTMICTTPSDVLNDDKAVVVSSGSDNMNCSPRILPRTPITLVADDSSEDDDDDDDTSNNNLFQYVFRK